MPPEDTAKPFYGLLTQASTLGAKRIRSWVLPQFIGFIVFAAFAGLIVASISLHLGPQIIGLAIALFMVIATMGLLLSRGTSIHPAALNILVVIVVISFQATGAFVVVSTAFKSRLMVAVTYCLELARSQTNYPDAFRSILPGTRRWDRRTRKECHDSSPRPNKERTLKVEWRHGQHFAAICEAKDAVPDSLRWYNRNRMHSTLG